MYTPSCLWGGWPWSWVDICQSKIKSKINIVVYAHLFIKAFKQLTNGQRLWEIWFMWYLYMFSYDYKAFKQLTNGQRLWEIWFMWYLYMFSYDYMLFCVCNWWIETGGFVNKINKLWIFYKHTSYWAVYTDERERGCAHGLAGTEIPRGRREREPKCYCVTTSHNLAKVREFLYFIFIGHSFWKGEPKRLGSAAYQPSTMLGQINVWAWVSRSLTCSADMKNQKRERSCHANK